MYPRLGTTFESSSPNISIASISSVDGSDISECDVQKKYVEVKNYWQEFLSYYVKNNITLKCLERTAKLINKVPGTSMKIPDTKHKILKKFREECDICYDFYILCEKCKTYTLYNVENNSKTHCFQCGDQVVLQEENFFVHIGITNQLKGIIKKYWSEISAKINEDARRNSGFIRDITDGDILKSLNVKKNNAYNLTLVMNTDGANAFESNQKSIWPIHFYLNFLPPSLRFQLNNIIVGALYIGERKPDILNFFKPLAKELEQLHESRLTVEIGALAWQFNISLTQTSLDLPAKAMLQNLCQYNGSYACGYCLHPGEAIKNRNNIRTTIKYTCANKAYELRNNLDFLKTMEKMDELSKVKWFPLA